jgi:hypothetical protein
MGFQKKIIGKMLALAFMISSCEKIDFTGMVVPGESADERFEQSIECNGNQFKELNIISYDYTIFSMGDSHVGNTDNMDQFFSRLKSVSPVAALLAGDMTNGKTEDYDAFQNHLPAGDSLPVFMVAGNHDMNFGGWQRYHDRFGSSTYYFTVRTQAASDIYICLETGGATLGKEQLEWLTGVLKIIRPDYRYCIVLTHNNLFRTNHTSGTYLNVEELYILIDLFAEYGVNTVITAHNHERSLQVLGGTTYITLPALTEDLDNPGFLQVNISSNGLDYKFLDIQ